MQWVLLNSMNRLCMLLLKWFHRTHIQSHRCTLQQPHLLLPMQSQFRTQSSVPARSQLEMKALYVFVKRVTMIYCGRILLYVRMLLLVGTMKYSNNICILFYAPMVRGRWAYSKTITAFVNLCFKLHLILNIFTDVDDGYCEFSWNCSMPKLAEILKSLKNHGKKKEIFPKA